MSLDRLILRCGDAYLVDLDTLELATGPDARARAIVMTSEQMQTAFARLVDGNPTLDEYCAEDPPDRDNVRGVLQSGDGYLVDPETLEMVSGPGAKEKAAVFTPVQMRLIKHKLISAGLDWDFIEVEDGLPAAEQSHQSFDPADLYAAARLFDQWRHAIEIEVERHPHARTPLNGLSVDLRLARDLITDCAQQVERYLSGTRDTPSAETPTETPRT